MRQIHGITEPGVGWSSDPACFDDDRLLSWEERLVDLPELQSADLVLSDNLTAMLDHRPDAVLAGSFLWSEVLATAYPDHPRVAAFAQKETERLRKHRPPMLCVADLMMPAVRQQTTAVPLPWMCEEPATPQPASRGNLPLIAVAGGATGSAEDILGRAVEGLAQKAEANGWRLALPTGFRAYAGSLAAHDTLPFDATVFASAAVMVCRPGVGTMTDCVTHRLPMVVLHEKNNPEMAHNGRRVRDLGLGTYLEGSPQHDTVLAAVKDLLDTRRQAQIRSTMAKLPHYGLEQAACWLKEHSTAS